MMIITLRSRSGWAFAAAIAAALLLSGCSHAPSDVSLNRIQTKGVEATHMVAFAPGSATLTPSETDGLRAFLGTGRLTGINSVTLVGGDSPIANARRARVSETLSALGFPHRLAPADPSFTADAVMIAVDRKVAMPPACPNWSPIGSFDPSNAPLSNLGCATRTDLYLMVADPHDLVSGHALAPADAAPSMAAVAAYRSGKPAAGLGSADGSGGASAGGTSTGSGGGSMTSAGGGYGQ